MQKIIECVPNFSEGKNLKIIKAIFNAAVKTNGVKVMELEYDSSHNRSLFTIVGPQNKVFDSVFEAIKMATKIIDMNKHKGEHPRIGATDVVPFIPISGVTMKECVILAKRLGKKVASELKIPVYLYENAAKRKAMRNLADVRKGEYEGLKKEIQTSTERRPDFGPRKMHPTAGAIVIGARKYLVAFNVNLKTHDVEVAKKIASLVREKNGGLPAVKALGFKVGRFAQVSMNLVDFKQTNFDAVYNAIEKHARLLNTEIKNSEIYGMIPLESIVSALKTTFKIDRFKSEQILEKNLWE